MVNRSPIRLNRERENLENSLVNAIDFDEFFKETREVLKEIMSDPNYYTNKKLQAKVRMIRAGIVSAWEDKQFWDAVDSNDQSEIKSFLRMFKNDTKDLIQKVEISGPDGEPFEQVGYLAQRDRELLMSIKEAFVGDMRPAERIQAKDVLAESNE